MNDLIKILQGNCLDKIKELDDNSIDCVISSPPYFGLRDYGVDGQFGLEKTYQDYIANTVKVFETFKPKLKDTATIWWNVGDNYKDKNLLMIPNRVAIALQEAGWYIRSEIIWQKPNAMPESVRDRPTSCHEKIWLITKNKKYYYDADAIKEDAAWDKWGKQTNPKGTQGKANLFKEISRKEIIALGKGKRNKRNVWTINTKPFKDAHFATFPKNLIEPCVKAGCPEGGVVLDPFGGAGTTGIVAALNNRKSIIIELNQDYIQIFKKRINDEQIY
tara:strand:- start:34 stop:858 length:825 start_codon:yes stop_codon:yes gene_type:complete